MKAIRYVQSWCVCMLAMSAWESSMVHAAENEVRIQQVEVAVSEVGPVVLLKAENRAIPVFVDATVAESIHAALSGGRLRRPFTHDLMHSVLSAYDGRVTHVVITLKESTFYAALTVVLRDSTKVFDSRASDAIALATHFKAPIMVPRELLETAGKSLDAPGVKTPPLRQQKI
jgi:bifunctional DNase/RNase